MLYGHFSLNAAFIWWTYHQRVVTCAAVLIHEWNITHFLFAYGTYHPHTCMLAPKLNPLPRGIDIRYNTVRQEALPRMDTGWCLLLFHTIAIKILSSSLSIIFFNNWTDKFHRYCMVALSNKAVRHGFLQNIRHQQSFLIKALMHSGAGNILYVMYARVKCPVVFRNTYTTHLVLDACPLNTIILRAFKFPQNNRWAIHSKHYSKHYRENIRSKFSSIG